MPILSSQSENAKFAHPRVVHDGDFAVEIYVTCGGNTRGYCISPEEAITLGLELTASGREAAALNNGKKPVAVKPADPKKEINEVYVLETQN